MDNEDRGSECKVFHRVSDPLPPLLHKEVTQRGTMQVSSRPVGPREISLALPIVDTACADRRLWASPRSAGNALYLASIAVIAITIAGIFFGAGYSVLAPSVRGPVSSFDYRLATPKQQVAERWSEGTLPRPISPLIAGVVATVALTPADPLPVSSRPAPPADQPLQKASEAPAPTDEGAQMAEAPARSGSSARPGHQAPEQPAPASAASPTGSAVPDGAASTPNLSRAEISDLLKHGDAFVSTGDLASARLFYERAAIAGDSRAALRLGATFDPDFLNRAGLRNVKGDTAVARSWYSRALDLGVPEAQRQLNSLNSKQGPQPR